MAKIIKLTAEHIAQAVQAFKEALTNNKFSDGEISYRSKLGNIDRKATVIFKEIAWLKMSALVSNWDKEIAWHGIAKRGDGDSYIIENILVYPQEVTGATVTTDQEKYQMWLMSQDDETFNNIRMQGHSHVKMGVTPSSVDTSLYERLLAQLSDDMFYIFMIWNKMGDKTIKIYDLEKNIFFDTSDCEVVVTDEIGMQSFLNEAKELVKDKPAYQTVTPSKTTAATTTSKPKVEVSKGEDKTKRMGRRKEDSKYKCYDDPYAYYRDYYGDSYGYNGIYR